MAWLEGRYMRAWSGGRKVLVHRLIWEQAYGPVPAGFSIHHRNGNRCDNRLENLELMELGEHIRWHKKGKPLSDATRAAQRVAIKNMPAEFWKMLSRKGHEARYGTS